MQRAGRVVTVLVCLAAALGGCRSPRGSIVEDAHVVYRFENVRRIGEFDEWPHILEVLTAHAEPGNPPVKVEPSEERVAGAIHLKDYRAELTVARLSDVDLINGDLERLSQQRFGHETIDFKRLDATTELRYRSNYVVAQIGIEISGFTDPGAALTVLLHDGTEHDVEVAADGSWKEKFQIAPNHRYVYGYSTDKAGGMKKYFRIDVFTQQQEPIAPSDFARMRRYEP
jgi:predicted RNA-binding Zn ribbon-like protein